MTTAHDDIEKVARAICRVSCRLWHLRPPFDKHEACPDRTPCQATRDQLILTDLWPEAQAAITATPPELWCEACGTVTRDRECDCTKAGNPSSQRLKNFVESLRDEWQATLVELELLREEAARTRAALRERGIEL